MINRYAGRCERCGGQILSQAGLVNQINGKWHLTHSGGCPLVLSAHASGDFGLAKNIDGHEFKPDASAPTKPNARCDKCGTTTGVAWIAGAGRYFCYRHQDDY